VVAIIVGPPFRLRTLNPPKVLEKVKLDPGDVMLIVAPVVDSTAVAPASDSSGVLRNTISEETVVALFSVRRCPAAQLRPPVVTLPATVKSCPELMMIDPPAVAAPVALVSGFNCPAAAPTVMSAPAEVPVVVKLTMPPKVKVAPLASSVSGLGVKLLKLLVEPLSVMLPPTPPRLVADKVPPAVGNVSGPSMGPAPASSSRVPPAPAGALSVRLPKLFSVMPPDPLFRT